MDTQNYNYAVVEENGAIESIYSSPYRFVECGESVLDTTHYVDNQTLEVTPKAPLEYVVDTEGLTVTLTGLPPGVTLTANALFIVTDDEPTEVAFDVPGTYTISLAGKVEYLDAELEVTVGET